jgi:DNA polymerase-3 subunit delta'
MTGVDRVGTSSLMGITGLPGAGPGRAARGTPVALARIGRVPIIPSGALIHQTWEGEASAGPLIAIGKTVIRFNDILGHARPIEILRRALDSGRLHHAWLFHGPEGVGKRTLAEAFAAALLCERPGSGGPCGQCPGCVKCRAGSHPDLHRLEVPEGRSRIPIEAFHALEGELQLVAYARRHRVAIVDPADLLSREAQHAFLKTLEEPRPDTILILVTSRPSALLATINSRCQRIAFGPIPADLLAGHLVREKRADPARAALVASIARGSLGRAEALLGDKALADRDHAIGEIERACAGRMSGGIAWAEDFRGDARDRERALSLLDLLLLETRDVMVLASGGAAGDLAHRDLARETVRKAEAPGAAGRAGRVFDRIGAARRDILRNVNPALALQGLFADLAAGGRTPDSR